MLEKLMIPKSRFMDPEFKSMQVDTSGETYWYWHPNCSGWENKEADCDCPNWGYTTAKAGLAKDIILKIDGKSTEGMDVNQAVALIRGQPGTEVRLSMQWSAKGFTN